MPYRLSPNGLTMMNQLHKYGEHTQSMELALSELTQHQKLALEYLDQVAYDMTEYKATDYIEPSIIAGNFGYAPEAMREPLHGLYLKGLVQKKGE